MDEQRYHDSWQMDQEGENQHRVPFQDKFWVNQDGDVYENEEEVSRFNYIIPDSSHLNPRIPNFENSFRESTIENENGNQSNNLFSHHLPNEQQSQAYNNKSNSNSGDDKSPKEQTKEHKQQKNKKPNNYPTKNLLQFFFGSIITYLKKQIQDHQLSKDALEDWNNFLRECKNKRKTKDLIGAIDENEVHKSSSKKKKKISSTNNFSLKNYTKLVRIKTLRSYLRSMFRSRFLWRKVIQSPLWNKKGFIEKIPVLIKGFKHRKLVYLN